MGCCRRRGSGDLFYIRYSTDVPGIAFVVYLIDISIGSV